MRHLALAGIVAALIAAPATAEVAPSVGRGETVAGRTLAQWQIGWTRWRMGQSVSAIRRQDDCLQQGAGGQVRYLSTRYHEEHVYEVHCTIPATQYLMLGEPEIFCTNAYREPGFDMTRAGLTRCAQHFWTDLADPHPRVVLDGQPISPGPVVHTGLFRFTMPARDNQLERPGMTRVRVVAIARATMLRPLTPGAHTLITGTRYHDEPNEVVVYKLTVV